MADYDEALAAYEAVVGEYPVLKVKGKAKRYTSMNGNMFTFLDKEGGLNFRLSEDQKKAYNTEHGTSDVIQHNCVMHGYVKATPAIYGDPVRLEGLFARSYDHARTLKPKPTSKKPKTKKK